MNAQTFADDKPEKLEVLGCPFCGKKPEINQHHKERLWALLHRCKVMGPLTLDWQPSLSNLVRTWNTRASKM